MNINILCVGKIKEKFYVDAVLEYQKRLSRFANVNIIEVKDEKEPENASFLEKQEILKKEGERILSKLKKGYTFALCVEGKQLSSEELSSKMSELFVLGESSVNFIIGGSLGLSDEVKKAADFHLSFSKMTFPHQLMRAILAEQIYRAMKIRANEAYHK